MRYRDEESERGACETGVETDVDVLGDEAEDEGEELDNDLVGKVADQEVTRDVRLSL